MDSISAAKQFLDESRHPINFYDLGVALLLEFFATPVLRNTPYVPLRKRQLLPSWQEQVARLTDRHDPKVQEIIGHALMLRHDIEQRMNRVSRRMLLCAILLYVMVVWAAVHADDFLHFAEVLGGWSIAIGLATIICLTNRHWRQRGFR